MGNHIGSQIIPEQFANASPEAPHQVTHHNSTGTTRVTVKDGVVSHEQIPVSGYYPSQLPDGFMGARNVLSGQPVQDISGINAHTIFYLPGGGTATPENMVHAGLLVKGQHGGYELPQKGELSTGSTPEAEAPAAEDPIVQLLSPDALGVLEELDARTGSQAATNALVPSALVHLAAGDADAAVMSVVRSTGMEPERAAEIVHGMFGDVREKAASHMSSAYGVDGEQCFLWAEENIPAAERVLLAHSIYLGSKHAFEDLASKYKKAMWVKECSAQGR